MEDDLDEDEQTPWDKYELERDKARSSRHQEKVSIRTTLWIIAVIALGVGLGITLGGMALAIFLESPKPTW